jgi:hypothetical protein
MEAKAWNMLEGIWIRDKLLNPSNYQTLINLDH